MKDGKTCCTKNCSVQSLTSGYLIVRCKANGHAESTVLLRSLRIRVQDAVDKTENWHESNFRSAIRQLDEKARYGDARYPSNRYGIVCKVVSLKSKPVGIEISSPTCRWTKSMGSECRSSSSVWGKDI